MLVESQFFREFLLCESLFPVNEKRAFNGEAVSAAHWAVSILHYISLVIYCVSFRLYVNWRFMRGIEAQFLALQKGFNELIPQHLLKPFDNKELEVLQAV